MAVTVAAVVVVYLALGVAMWRFRARPDRRSPRPAREHHLVLAVYAIALLVIAVFLISATFMTEDRVDASSARPGAIVQVVASQWRWTFTYPGHPGARSVNRVVVPVDEVVGFRLRSTDVLHSMWFVAQRFKRYATPGSPTQFELSFDHPGRFVGECSQFCGIGHDLMRFTLVAVSPGAYDRWLARAGSAA